MGDRENDAVLPEGRSMEFRVRKNGKKDKIIIEKEAEGLPPGWTKEIKVTKTGRKVRRDPFYIDPVSGYVFRSMKDAVRYIETGKIGRLAFKRKDDSNQEEEELEDVKDNSPTSAKKQKITITGTEADITGQSAKLSDVVKDENAGELISHSEQTSGQGDAGTESRGPNTSEVNDSDKTDKGKDSDINAISTPLVGVLPDGRSSNSGEDKDETKKPTHEKCKSRKKKVFDLPRRSSKRLAGLALNPTPELKTNNRACQTVAKQSDEIEASTVENSFSDRKVLTASQQPDQPEADGGSHTSKSKELSSDTSDSKHCSEDLNGPSGKIEMKCKNDKKQGYAVTLPLKNQERIETEIEADEKRGPPIDLPFEDLLSDPCIAFAIKTLTGETFESTSDKEVSQESNSRKTEGLANIEQLAGKKKGKKKENEGDKKQEGLVAQVEQPANISSNLKADDLPENSLDLPSADIWRDPCIQFAIKTLTGAIPVGNDLDARDYFQQQSNSSQSQTSNNFCLTEFVCQQYDSLEKPISSEQARTGNLSIPTNPAGGTNLHQRSEKRYNQCH